VRAAAPGTDERPPVDDLGLQVARGDVRRAQDLDDLLSAVTAVSDSGPGGDVIVGFANGASITFLGSGTGSIAALADLVTDAANQIVIS